MFLWKYTVVVTIYLSYNTFIVYFELAVFYSMKRFIPFVENEEEFNKNPGHLKLLVPLCSKISLHTASLQCHILTVILYWRGNALVILLLTFKTCSFHKISKKQTAQGNKWCCSYTVDAEGWLGWRSMGVGKGRGQGGCTVGLGSWERGRDGPKAPSEMPARHGSSQPGLGFRGVKSEKTNLPVDLEHKG